MGGFYRRGVKIEMYVKVYRIIVRKSNAINPWRMSYGYKCAFETRYKFALWIIKFWDHKAMIENYYKNI